MQRRSAGVLVYRCRQQAIEVLLAHPGGPYFRRRDEWGIPKGLIEPNEDPREAALRELREETGVELAVDSTDLVELGTVSRGDKDVTAFAYEADLDTSRMRSNEFEMEWPPRSGRRQRYPELDRFGYFELREAATKIHAYQRPLLVRLEDLLGSRESRAPGADAGVCED